jgi:sRNA-binding regulator protein Hfq
MRDATLLHNNVIRELLKKHQGYEVMMKNAGEGSFCLVFQHAIDALEWSMDVQAEYAPLTTRTAALTQH